MIKIEKNYIKEYGEVSKDWLERVNLLLSEVRGKSKDEIDSIIHQASNVHWESYDCIVWLLPKGSNRPRRRKDCETFYVSGAQDNSKIFRRFMKDHPHDIICTPIIFNCDIFLPTPRSMNSTERVLAEMGFVRPICKPDFDNLAKTYSDMLTGNLIYDDDLIIESTIKKYYSIKPRIEIHLKYMTDFDSRFNKRKVTKRIEKIQGKDDE